MRSRQRFIHSRNGNRVATAAVRTGGPISAWYEPHALVRSDQLDHISGMLVGLSAFDFNIYLRGEDLEKRSDVIDWSMYLRDGNVVPSASGVYALPECAWVCSLGARA